LEDTNDQEQLLQDQQSGLLLPPDAAPVEARAGIKRQRANDKKSILKIIKELKPTLTSWSSIIGAALAGCS
jgi:hypothetical protein